MEEIKFILKWGKERFVSAWKKKSLSLKKTFSFRNQEVVASLESWRRAAVKFREKSWALEKENVLYMERIASPLKNKAVCIRGKKRNSFFDG